MHSRPHKIIIQLQIELETDLFSNSEHFKYIALIKAFYNVSFTVLQLHKNINVMRILIMY